MTPEAIRAVAPPLAYLLSSSLFIYGLKRLARVRTARTGNAIAALAMLFAVVGTLVELGVIDYRWITVAVVAGASVGAFAALRVRMTAMPEMVALLNGLGGAASALVALSVLFSRAIEPGTTATAAAALGAVPATTAAVSLLVGGVTFAGSLVAFLKLRGRLAEGRPIVLRGRHALSLIVVACALASAVAFAALASGATELAASALALSGLALALGVLVVIPIGGADMPVVVSLLNAASGVAAAAAGFVIGNPALVIAGAMVGAAGLILTRQMCAAMNRSLPAVLIGGFGQTEGPAASGEYVGVKSAQPEEAAMILDAAREVVIVPGYGLAVAQAQHAVKELADALAARGARVRYAIHPVAGRMPGHMNVLLAEADVPYEQLFDLRAIEGELRTTDVAIVIGANDVVNPAAIEDRTSPIFGMPILRVHEAKTVLVVKRSLAPGYAGIKNALFERHNALMLFGDAKDVVSRTTKALRDL